VSCSEVHVTAQNYPRWMENAVGDDRYLDTILFIGTHDSLMFQPVNITTTFANMTTLAKYVSKLAWLPCLSHKMSRWSRTQSSTVAQQLDRGIRMFDFRTTLTSEFICVGLHSFTCGNFEQSLQEMSDFLHTNTREILILRYSSDQEQCDALLYKYLSDFLLMNTGRPVLTYTAGELRQVGRVILQKEIASKNASLRPYCFQKFVEHEWKNTFDIEEKSDFMTTRLESYNEQETPNLLYNLDWTLTPQVNDVIFGSANLLHYATSMNDALSKYLKTMSVKSRKKIGSISIDNENSFDLLKSAQLIFGKEMRRSNT
jgi:hypothetical protein